MVAADIETETARAKGTSAHTSCSSLPLVKLMLQEINGPDWTMETFLKL